VNTRTRSLSWTGTGVAIPPEEKAAEVFAQLFLQGSPAQVAAQIRKLDTGRSILDTVAGQAKELQRNVTVRDRDTSQQERIPKEGIGQYLREKLGQSSTP
jgi:hypothetical protein